MSAVVIRLPALRDRVEDIPALTGYFLRRFRTELSLSEASIQPDALAWLKEQRWPGNVRQLENILRQGVLAARGFPITREMLELIFSRNTETSSSDKSPIDAPLESLMDELLAQAKAGGDLDVHAKVFEAMERELFTRAIQLAQGNQAKAARWLKMSRQTVREKLQAFGLKEQAGADTEP